MESSLIYMAAFVVLLAVSIATGCMAVRNNGRGIGDLMKKLIICVAIAALMPLTSWAGATMIHPRVKLVELREQMSRVQQETFDTQDPAQRNQRRDKLEELNRQVRDETRLFYRAMFWVGFPVGLVAMVAGLFIRSIAAGVGLAFGGLSTLVSGCYSYWDDMGDHLRFWSLLAVLVILISIGLTKFGKAKPPALAVPA